ncbi:hypothetical protein HRI_004202600 [Hibiscus trionum]|uniref:Endonuclease/exonuclease/phosphatase domain-containing protein n=1 Tax=Hibiscus trionum TaxID=183268 RepID=A0A9W7MKG2_HIBTR|nr:hypothetical protein HRI_004202600 [Hibiscus trionum]
MTFLIWNVRGLNDPMKQSSVTKVIRKLKVEVVCLLETRVKIGNLGSIVSSRFRDWTFVNNYSAAVNGRIWLLYRGGWKVEVLHCSDQVITCLFEFGEDVFYFSIVYACNGREDRKRLWLDLINYRSRVGSRPWILAGDFNIIRCPQESSDYDGIQTVSGAMRDFQDCQEILDVVDHPFIGALFT